MLYRLSVVLVCILLCAPAQGAVINVPADQATIQAAVNAASPGDTIKIAAGTYSEHVLITTSYLTIKGATRDTTIIDATQTGGRLPGIEADGVTGMVIRDLTVQNAALGVPSYTDIDVNQYGILLADQSNNNTIRNVKLLNNGLYEIFLWDKSNDNTIRDCYIDGYYSSQYHSLNGIFSSGGSVAEGGHDGINSGNVFRDNTIKNVIFGISLTASNDNKILDNDVDAADSPFWLTQGFFSYDVNLFASSSNQVKGNKLGTSEDGVRMRDPLVGDSYTYAGPPNDNNVVENTIDCTRYGVNIRGGSDNEITDNDISGATAGVYLQNSTFPRFTTGTTVSCNFITDNTTGILTEYGLNTAHYNSIHGNDTGVTNTDTQVFDATYNWWGAASGPGPVGPGTGDTVSTNVAFSPWLTAALGKIQISVQLEDIVSTPVTRTITFLSSATSAGAVTLSKALVFTNGLATTTICFPTGCLSAKDRQHSLFSTVGTIHTGGPHYTANFTGADKLLGGDANNDNVDDIWDFGILMSQIGTGGHPYLWPILDADFTDSGTVNSSDFLTLYKHFLQRGDPPCGLTIGQLPVPRSSITVAQLAPLVGGLTNAKKADLNRDGKVDATDVRIYYLSLLVR